MKIDEFAPLAKSALTALKSLGGPTARTIAKKLAPKSAGTNMIGRTPGQDKGTGGTFSGNPPKKSLSSIGAMPGAKTSSIGTGNNSSDSPTTDDTTPGTNGPVGPQSAADMRDSESNAIDTGSTFTAGTSDMQNAQSNTVEPEELKSGDKLTVKVEPGNKNLKLVYPDENTEAEVPRELLRLQQLAGMQQ